MKKEIDSAFIHSFFLSTHDQTYYVSGPGLTLGYCNEPDRRGSEM